MCLKLNKHIVLLFVLVALRYLMTVVMFDAVIITSVSGFNMSVVCLVVNLAVNLAFVIVYVVRLIIKLLVV